MQRLGMLSLLVDDYDRAIDYYTKVLGFSLVEDTDLPAESKRWVVVSPSGPGGACLLLAKARNDEQRARIGDQAGGRVFLFLYTDDFAGDVDRYTARGVEFVRAPSRAPFGMVAVLRDLYGNQWDLIQRDQ